MTTAIHANQDRFSLRRFKADQSCLIGPGRRPIEACLDIPGMPEPAIASARRRNQKSIERAPAPHPGDAGCQTLFEARGRAAP